MHLNRSDYYLQSAPEYQLRDDDDFRRRMTIAHCENRMMRTMEKYFPETLSRSSPLLPTSIVSHMKANAPYDTGYARPVSKAQLTRADEPQVAWTTLPLPLPLTLLTAERRLAARHRA